VIEKDTNNYSFSFEDEGPSNTEILIDKKRKRLDIPINIFLSNRFIKNNIIEEDKG